MQTTISPQIYPLIDTHTHFDVGDFDADRTSQAVWAWQNGVRHLLLIGYLQRHFERMIRVNGEIKAYPTAPKSHLALGLHPLYIQEHSEADLQILHDLLQKNGLRQDLAKKNQSENQSILAIGEIGLDTFLPELKQPDLYQKQRDFFVAQLDMAVEFDLPVLLHIRKAHADCLQILKKHAYNAKKYGGIAHSFSGGEQEAKAFIKLGFKLGITGQITNPNAKKLRRAIFASVQTFGLQCLVLETDCPDMTPLPCQIQADPTSDRNVPANLIYVLQALSELLQIDPATLAKQCWQNSLEALKVDWIYPQDL